MERMTQREREIRTRVAYIEIMLIVLDIEQKMILNLASKPVQIRREVR